MDDFVLDTNFYKNLYTSIYLSFRVLLWLSDEILFKCSCDLKNVFFTYVANVYLTHSLLESQLMCSNSWKYVDIE